MTARPLEVLTIGHSTLLYGRFLERLRAAHVTAIADVRTAPFSKQFPQFNRDILRDELVFDRIAYVFLGDKLGGRPKDERLFCEGVADYEKMARTEDFCKGIERVIEGAKKYKIAMMCSEHDPLDCHRCLLVGRALSERGVAVKHILSNGAIVKHAEIEERLLELARQTNDDLFEPHDKRLAAAYRKRSMKVAYVQPGPFLGSNSTRSSRIGKL